MQLRIIKRIKGEVDGIPLDRYRVGETYDVGSRLAAYLLAMGAAVPAADEIAAPTRRPGARKRKGGPREH